MFDGQMGKQCKTPKLGAVIPRSGPALVVNRAKNDEGNGAANTDRTDKAGEVPAHKSLSQMFDP
jgi:hypothetical protein